MRQAGILAAAAVYALNNHLGRLGEDHIRARKLGESIAKLPGIDIDLASLQTNIVIFNVKKSGLSGNDVITKLVESNIKMLTFGSTKIRAVTHLQISDVDIHKTIEALQVIFPQN